MDNIIDFSDISQEYARIKTEVKNDLVNEFNKIPQLNIETNQIEEKKAFQLTNISWKTYRSISILILFSSIFFSHFLKLHFEKRNTDPYLNMVLNILLLFFIFNTIFKYGSVFLFSK